jgi:hypothetical protein
MNRCHINHRQAEAERAEAELKALNRLWVKLVARHNRAVADQGRLWWWKRKPVKIRFPWHSSHMYYQIYGHHEPNADRRHYEFTLEDLRAYIRENEEELPYLLNCRRLVTMYVQAHGC